MSAKHNYDTEELDTGCTGRKPHANITLKRNWYGFLSGSNYGRLKAFLASRCVSYFFTVKQLQSSVNRKPIQDPLISSDVKINRYISKNQYQSERWS